jgi:hypothetical protein
VICLSTYFITRGYPVELLQEAAILVRDLERHTLLHPPVDETTPKNVGDIFLISTYHPHTQFLREMVFKNWKLLGKSPTTDFIHKKHVLCGYRRPKNLRDLLVRAQVPQKQGDELADPTYVATPPPPEIQATPSTNSVN